MKTLVLVVEDSPTQAARLKHILQQSGFDVLVAPRASDALKIARSEKPQLIVSDVSMPEMDGYELCRRVRADAQLQNLAILLLTGLSDPEDIIRGLDAGADSYLTKPYEESDLAARIEFVLSNRVEKRTSETPLEVTFLGKKHCINSSREQILGLLLSTYESAAQQNRRLNREVLSLKMLQRELQLKAKTNEEETRDYPLALRAMFSDTRNPVLAVNRQGGLLDLNQSAQATFGPSGAGFIQAIGDEHRSRWNGLQIQWNDLELGEMNGELQTFPCSWAEQSAYLVTVKPARPLQVPSQAGASKGARSEFLGQLSLQLREALRPLQSSRTQLTPEQQKALKNLENLDVLRLSSLQWLLSPQPTRIEQLLKACLEHFSVQTLAESREVQLQLECPDGEPEWQVDPELVQSSLIRLLRNAIQYSPEGATVKLKATLEEDWLTAEVSDSGPGVPPPLIPELFNLFATGPGGGLGSGLYYARCVSQAHGGSLVYEALNPGALFRLKLPRNVESRN
ncbi:response regulator [bacterium]|nr:response regulator [bacterium]